MKHIKKFNETFNVPSLVTDFMNNNEYQITWDSIYTEYLNECLDNDSDFTMELIDWLKFNFKSPNERVKK
jgi:hypothetical protein